MAFCPYCGKQLNDGEVCSCTLAGVAGSGTVHGPKLPSAAAHPTEAPAQPEPLGASGIGGAAPGAYIPPQSTSAPQSNPRDLYSDTDDFFASSPAGTSAAPNNGMAPSAYAPPAQAASARPQSQPIPQQADFPRPAVQQPAPQSAQSKASMLGDIVNPLIDRIKLLFSDHPDEAIERSIKTTDMSWALVCVVYVLLGTLAASFAVPKVMQGFFGDYATYGDMLGSFFGDVFWRSLLINIITFGIALGTVIGVCGATKTNFPFARALNLVGMAFVPAAALNALGFLFSFFFPAGTLICGLVSAVCTVVMLCIGLGSLTGRKNMWLHVIIACSLVLVYALVLYIFMDAMIESMIEEFMSSLMGGLSSMFW